MLVTAGNLQNHNTMTASWGGVGWLWNRPVAFVFVRPERYTHEFMERNERVTLSFFDESHRKALQICGTKSGRDGDKEKEAGLTPMATEDGSVSFSEARLMLDCRKLFKTEMTAEAFLDKSILGRWYGDYPGGSMHSMYVAEIEKVYEK